MKKVFFTVFFAFCLANMVQAQVWFDVAAKGAYGISLLFNNNIWEDDTYSNKFSTGYGLGGKLGMNFGDFRHGIAFDAIYYNGRQQWDYKTNQVTTPFEIKWNSIDLYLLYRYGGIHSYFELGPKLSMIQSVKQTGAGVSDFVETTKNYNNRLWGGSIGFGGYVLGSEVLSLNLGIRVDYSFTDFISEPGKALNYPNPNRPAYTNYTTTNPIAALLTLELNFGIGQYARAECGKRAFFFSFDQ